MFPRSQSVNSASLVPGDLVIFYDTKLDLHFHVSIVSNKKIDNMSYLLHAGIVPTPHINYFLPYSAERLQDMGWECRVFHINDDVIRKKFISILETWAEYAIKFDYDRFDIALEKNRELLQTDWNFEKRIFPNMFNIPQENIDKTVKEMEALFDINHAIKYAVRREIIPVKPVQALEHEHGFRCAMFALTALQAAYIMDDVPVMNDKWSSLRNNMFANPVVEAVKSQQLGEAAFREQLINKIPAELRLSTRYCVPEILIRSISRGADITARGTLQALHDNELPDKAKADAELLELIRNGERRKEEFRVRVVESSTVALRASAR